MPLSVTNEAPELKADGEGPVPLARLVRPRPGYESVINHLLSQVLFCSDLEQALSWWQLHPNAYILVTAEGDLIAQDGTLWGGSQEQQISILEKQEERKGLEAEITASEERLKKERDKSRKVDEQLAQIVSRLQSIQENQQILRDQLLEQEKKHYRSQAEHQGIIERLAVLELEKDHDEEEVSQLQTELSQSERELEALEERKEEAEEDLAEAQHQRQEQENIVDSLQEKATAQQVSVGALVEKKEAARSSHQRLEEYAAEGDRRDQQLLEEKKKLPASNTSAYRGTTTNPREIRASAQAVAGARRAPQS